jgi:hypothetical protein
MPVATLHRVACFKTMVEQALSQATGSRGVDLAERRRTFEWFVRGVFLFAAHILVILALLALFRG